MDAVNKMGFVSRLGAAWRLAVSGSPPEVREKIVERVVVREAAPVTPPPPPPEPDTAQWNAKIAGLRMDLEERDRTISALKKEYELLRNRAETEQGDAGREALAGLLGRIAPLLSQLATLRSLSDGGTPVKAEDLLKLMGKVETLMHEAGLEPIGRVGEDVPFDGRLHQRMSGGWLKEEDMVRVRFVGYRFKGTVIKKAMVSKREEDENRT
jgi:molecular chaperone GrpE